MNKMKVRFAPSPTGPLHIGGARSALFNYLIARHEQGQLVVRIEDTDLDRSRSEYETEIIESLRWLGMDWEEGIDKGGENAPYRQTERLETYQAYAQQLIESGHAYYCFCSEEELEQERMQLMEKGETPRYLGKCRSLNQALQEEKRKAGIVPTVRFKVPENQVYVVNDLVRGQVTFESEAVGDFIIMKSDGIPTYNFAVVIDDVLMGITHVIRAEEHLTNTPRQLMIYEALRFKRPEFAHVSLILGNDRQKMSKRHGATSVIQYREKGYLPEALFNFLALLGWAPPGEEEILSQEQIIAAFTLDKVSRSPAVFDIDKLNWFNQQYIKRLDIEELHTRLNPFIEKSPLAARVGALGNKERTFLLEAVHDRLVCLEDINEYLPVFLGETVYEPEAMEVLSQEGVAEVLKYFAANLPEFEQPDEIKNWLKTIAKELKIKPREVFMPLRCALTGQMHGVDLHYLIAVWGQAETLKRLQAAQNNFNLD